MPKSDARLHSPSVGRNRDAVLAVLREHLPASASVLEIGSGSGEHAVHVATALPRVTWIPSDPDPRARASVEAWRQATALHNVHPALDLDVEEVPWQLDLSPDFAERERIDVVLSINMIHITPPSTTTGLLAGASELLRPSGRLILYGPFRRNGQHTAPSNADFDRWLKDRHPSFGVRDLETLEREALDHGLVLQRAIDMPANNFTVIFERQ